MGDRLWAGKPSRYLTGRPGQLSLPSLRGRYIEYRPVWQGLRRLYKTFNPLTFLYFFQVDRGCSTVKPCRVHLCRVVGNTVIPHGKWHSVALRWSSINSCTRLLTLWPFYIFFQVDRDCSTVKPCRSTWSLSWITERTTRASMTLALLTSELWSVTSVIWSVVSFFCRFFLVLTLELQGAALKMSQHRKCDYSAMLENFAPNFLRLFSRVLAINVLFLS